MKDFLSKLRSKIKVINPGVKAAPILVGFPKTDEQIEIMESGPQQESEINDSAFSSGFKIQSSPAQKAKAFLNKFNFRINKPLNFSSNSDYGSFVSSKKPLLLISLFILLLTSALGLAFIYYPKNTPQNVATNPSMKDNRATIAGAKSQKDINREFAFPLKDDKGKEVAKIKYVIEDAQLRDEILVKGQRATAIKGKTFLILDLKVTNEYTKPVEINTRDYVRFITGDKTDQQAADIHNDPVVIQAESTKLTRIGLTINDQDTQKIKLLVGEIKADKQTIDIQF